MNVTTFFLMVANKFFAVLKNVATALFFMYVVRLVWAVIDGANIAHAMVPERPRGLQRKSRRRRLIRWLLSKLKFPQWVAHARNMEIGEGSPYWFKVSVLRGSMLCLWGGTLISIRCAGFLVGSSNAVVHEAALAFMAILIAMAICGSHMAYELLIALPAPPPKQNLIVLNIAGSRYTAAKSWEW